MRFEADFAETAALLGEPARAAMLAALLDRPAMSAGQLAFAAKVSAQAASFHLAKLTSASILTVERVGRTKVYRLSGSEIAGVIESLAAISPSRNAGQVGKRWSGSERQQQLRFARTCYDHLAGVIGVELHDSLLSGGYLVESGERQYQLTDQGNRWLNKMGLNPEDGKTRSPFVRPCMDWTEREPHLAGRLATQLLDIFFRDKWIARISDTRAVRVTDRGIREFECQFGLDLKLKRCS